MNDGKKVSKEDFGILLNDLINEIGTLELPVGDDSLKKFCEYTGHDYSVYTENNLIPQGYLMTITIPIFTRFFKRAWGEFIPKIIKGVIHTFSTIEYYSPFKMDQKYFGKMGVKSIEEKKGKKGEYFSVDFEIIVCDDKGATVASDIHKFFLKT